MKLVVCTKCGSNELHEEQRYVICAYCRIRFVPSADEVPPISSGYISGDDVIQVERGTAGWFTSATNVSDSLMKSLTVIRRNALAEHKEAAYELGCNAVVGVDFDYLTLDPQTANSSGGTLYLPYVFGVTANGNAVIIEQS